MKEIKNFLEQDEFYKVRNEILGENFPWFLSNGVATPMDGHHMLSHIAYIDNKVNSDFYNFCVPIIKKLDAFSLVRIKANFHWQTKEIIEHGYHNDFLDLKNHTDLHTAVYYINTNNGYTKFKSTGKKFYSESNKMIVFNANEIHTGSSCTDNDFRIVINFNYFPS